MAEKILTVRSTKHGYLVEENVPIGRTPYTAPNVNLYEVKDAISRLRKALGIRLDELDDIELTIDIQEVE